jgi:hypothetical protein
MTTKSSPEGAGAASRGDDQRPAELRYGHGRMPLFMKLVWLAFLAFGAWYTVTYLLASLGEELGG